MPVAAFDTRQFEAALPKHMETGEQLWVRMGLEMGEYTYAVSAMNGTKIIVRSSISTTGKSAGTGKNSIRLWLIDPATKKPLSSKTARWITRVNGWQGRLTASLRELYKVSAYCGPCPKCGAATGVYNTRDGRLFRCCVNDTCQFRTSGPTFKSLEGK